MGGSNGGNGKGKTGAVLVVGAGIAGIQASLDLANSGYRVYLVEQSSSIGGTMTQLDKTFPTNDCSMCIVSPKLVECARHPNVRMLTYAELERLEGEAGSFRAVVRHKARSVDAAKCTGCGACQAACPVRNTVRVPEAVDDELSERTRRIDAIIDSYGAARESMITVLQDANKAFNFLPEVVLHRIATRLGVPYAEVYGAASFYKAFSLEPRGKHIVQVCVGTACHVRGAQRILEEFERRLDIPAGRTTKDDLFTLETVNCLGACALGPIVAIDGDFHGSMTAGKVPRLLDAYAAKVAS
jgi:NADH:ubiquinone oxidoreductase subunit E